MLNPRSDGLNDQPHRLGTNLGKTFETQYVMASDGFDQLGDIGIDIAQGSGVHLKGFKLIMTVIVMVVIVVVIIVIIMVVMVVVMLGPGVQIILGTYAKAQQQGWRNGAVAGTNHPHAVAQLGL